MTKFIKSCTWRRVTCEPLHLCIFVNFSFPVQLTYFRTSSERGASTTGRWGASCLAAISCLRMCYLTLLRIASLVSRLSMNSARRTPLGLALAGLNSITNIELTSRKLNTLLKNGIKETNSRLRSLFIATLRILLVASLDPLLVACYV